jgi:hypothetical protein
MGDQVEPLGLGKHSGFPLVHQAQRSVDERAW